MLFSAIMILSGCSNNNNEPTDVLLPTVPEQVGATEDPSVSGILEAHHAIRDPLNLPRLAYDTALADVATAWLEGLDAQGCIMEHDYSSPLGENLFWTSATATGEEVVFDWAGEVVDYDYDTNTCAAGAMCGHYTQIVWANTERVGCAMRTCSENRGELWMCTYDPAGNWVEEWPY